MKSLTQLMDLAGRVAVVTGGGGHIGRAMAEALGEAGAAVCLVDVNDARLAHAVQNVAEHTKARVDGVMVDLENEEARGGLPDEIRRRFGRLDVLINCAALGGDHPLEGWVVPFEEQSLSTWRRALEVNLTAAFHLSQLFTPMLRESGRGSIVNVGSTYGVVGPDFRLYEGTQMGNPGAYAATKGGLIQLTRYLATALAPKIRVNSMSPGGVFRNQPTEFVERYVYRTPMARMATEEDFKGATLFLSSDLSSYVTGHNLMVDGGWGAW